MFAFSCVRRIMIKFLLKCASVVIELLVSLGYTTLFETELMMYALLV